VLVIGGVRIGPFWVDLVWVNLALVFALDGLRTGELPGHGVERARCSGPELRVIA